MEIKESSKIEFRETKHQVSRTFCPINGDPIAIKAIRSGWNYGHPTYHVITEWGDMENSDYQFLSHKELEEKLGMNIDTEERSSPGTETQMSLISDLLKESDSHNLSPEVITWALHFMQENPGLEPYEAFALGYHEWVK